MRSKEFIVELFEPATASLLDWDWFKTSGVTVANGDVKIGNEYLPIRIRFDNLGEGTVNLEFSVGDQFELTGLGGAGPVFATVISAVKQFTQENPDVTSISFTADERSRAKMYDTLAKRVSRQLGWHVVPYDDMAQDPKYRKLMQYGGEFGFAVEKGQAPAHRQAAQKPQHGEFLPVYYVYSREDENAPIYKIKARKTTEAEEWVIKNVPEYRHLNPLGVFATKIPLPFVKDLGTVPPPKPQRTMNSLEQDLHDRLSQGTR